MVKMEFGDDMSVAWEEETFKLSSYGKAHVFYPEATETKCTAALLLEIDPIVLARGTAYGKNSFPGKGNPKQTDEEKEISRLKKQLRDMELERDILKKREFDIKKANFI